MGRIECEACDGCGEVEVDTVDGRVAEIECVECCGWGGWPLYGPPTRGQAAEIEAREAASEANAAKWATFVCTHCDRYCDAWRERGPQPCFFCPDGIVLLLADLQAAARPVLPWRREGDHIVAVPPPALEVRKVDGALDEVVATKGASVHLEAMSDFNPYQDEDACWWMAIEVGSETVHVTLSAKAPISAVVDRWTEPPKPGACDPHNACATLGRCWTHSEWDWETVLPAGWEWRIHLLNGNGPGRWVAHHAHDRDAIVFSQGQHREMPEHPEVADVARWVKERNDRDPPKDPHA